MKFPCEADRQCIFRHLSAGGRGGSGGRPGQQGDQRGGGFCGTLGCTFGACCSKILLVPTMNFCIFTGPCFEILKRRTAGSYGLKPSSGINSGDLWATLCRHFSLIWNDPWQEEKSSNGKMELKTYPNFPQERRPSSRPLSVATRRARRAT